MPVGKKTVRRDEVARMWADAVLPQEIRPDEPAESDATGALPRYVLLTGACGFLGRQVARELLRQTDLRLVCLVRDTTNETATARVIRILAASGIGREDLTTRVEVRTGDMTMPLLGLGTADYAVLAERLDAIYHCAAMVDWVRGYNQLCRVNVGGVLNVIRLACQGRAKRLVFVSSIAVCYARGGPERIDEDTNMLPFVGGMALGYARSKCVAEALLKQAAERGVPVTVLRPALIAGDSASGKSNPTDLIAALVQGCVANGMAMDTDWQLDCVPVDFVARVMAHVPQGDTAWQAMNLMHARPRHWRELVLWMNLHGYPVALVESNVWIRHLFDDGHARGSMLYAQRRFFSGRPQRNGEEPVAKPYEDYLAAPQRRINASRTRTVLRRLDLHEADLDTDLLHTYFAYYRDAGVLPARAVGDEESITLDQLLAGDWQYQTENETVDWLGAKRTRIGADDGLLSEIAAARLGGSVGLWRLCCQTAGPDADQVLRQAVLKVKASDCLIQDLTMQLAGVCRPELGALFGQYQDALGLVGSHERELTLYTLDTPGLRGHMPACLGSLRHPTGGRWALLLEYLPEASAGEEQPRLWANDAGMSAVLAGLADIHAAWYRRETDLLMQPWLVAPPSPALMLEMAPLWRELADFAAPWFETWCGDDIRALQADFITGLDTWWPRLRGMPSTLIHNDCNPRNMVLRQVDGQPWLCVYDWELATQGVPQHDLAELLCFIWHSDMTQADLSALLDTNRVALSRASGEKIDALEWRAGFALALRHLLINRLALYTLMHRFRPLAYLPEVMRNWKRLYAWAWEWAATEGDMG
ncbi:MAG: thioester reductase domain-containing protein [Thiobacillus sp.]